MFAPHSLGRALDGLEARGRRAAVLNQKLYGAALAVPISLTTRVSTPGESLAEGLAGLTDGRVPVVVVEPVAKPEPEPEPEAEAEAKVQAEAEAQVGPGPDALDQPVAELEPVVEVAVDQVKAEVKPEADAEPEAERPRRSPLGGLGTIVSRFARGRSHDVDGTDTDEADQADDADGAEAAEAAEAPGEDGADDEPTVPLTPAARVAVPLRQARRGLRAEVTRDEPATVLGSAALAANANAVGTRPVLPEGAELRRPGFGTDDSRVRPISTLGEAVEPLVVDDFVTEPAYRPVIGPELAAARTRVGLTVDELAERTRIRPHVIESIEVDDFAPCGGDFYARGHLRTLARVLGKDPQPLLAEFDNRYATAPINARKVFEAELATGMTGSMRRTVGGPNWALLVGVVLVLVMAWGVVRLFASEPTELLQPPAPALNGSAGVDSGHVTAPQPVAAPTPLRVTLVGAQGDSHVVVRSRSGKVAWAGDIVLGEKRTVKAVPPVRVHSSDAGAVDVRVNGKDKGPLGEAGKPGHRTFHAPAH
jgi:cytoskeleton protein RodZ